MREIVKEDVSDSHCVKCGVKFEKIYAIGNSSNRLRKNQIMICSNCTEIHILGDTSWKKLEMKDFDNLPDSTKRALLLTAKGLLERLKAGKEWSPYEKPNQGKG